MTGRKRPRYVRPIGYGRRRLLAAVCGAVAIWLVYVLVLAPGRRWPPGLPSSASPESLAEGSYRVARVVDGDTLLLANGARVRLIGADTPETVKPGEPVQPWGPEATKFTKEFVAAGTVRLQLDRERIDRFGRFLAYVWVDDRMLNEELIRAGLARARLEFRYSSVMKTRFRRAQQEAKAAGRGIWSL